MGGSIKYYQQKCLGGEGTVLNGATEDTAATSSNSVILVMFFSRNRGKEAAT